MVEGKGRTRRLLERCGRISNRGQRRGPQASDLFALGGASQGSRAGIITSLRDAIRLVRYARIFKEYAAARARASATELPTQKEPEGWERLLGAQEHLIPQSERWQHRQRAEDLMSLLSLDPELQTDVRRLLEMQDSTYAQIHYALMQYTHLGGSMEPFLPST